MDQSLSIALHPLPALASARAGAGRASRSGPGGRARASASATAGLGAAGGGRRRGSVEGRGRWEDGRGRRPGRRAGGAIRGRGSEGGNACRLCASARVACAGSVAGVRLVERPWQRWQCVSGSAWLCALATFGRPVSPVSLFSLRASAKRHSPPSPFTCTLTHHSPSRHRPHPPPRPPSTARRSSRPCPSRRPFSPPALVFSQEPSAYDRYDSTSLSISSSRALRARTRPVLSDLPPRSLALRAIALHCIRSPWSPFAPQYHQPHTFALALAFAFALASAPAAHCLTVLSDHPSVQPSAAHSGTGPHYDAPLN